MSGKEKGIFKSVSRSETRASSSLSKTHGCMKRVGAMEKKKPSNLFFPPSMSYKESLHKKCRSL